MAIVGEAVKKIKDIDPKELISYHSSIIGFRNLIIYSSDSVDDEIVWTIIKKNLQDLKKEVLEKLETG